MSEIKENPKTPTGVSATFLESSSAVLIKLVVEDVQLAVHKSVLVARSPVFAAMLTHDTVEASSSRIFIADVEPEVMRQLVVFMYKGSAPQLCSMAPQLLVAADKYCLPELKLQCELQLVQDLSVESAVASALLALRHSCQSLKEACQCFIQDNLTKVMETEGWGEAVRNNPEDFVELSHLLAATSNACQEETDRQLFEAVQNNSAKQVRGLLAAGAYISARDRSGRTALHYAAAVETAKYLLNAGALVNAKDKWHRTPLHTAIQRGVADVANLLVAACSNVDTADVCGDTPLHLATQLGEEHVVKALLNKGADKGARNNLRETPLDMAERYKMEHLLDVLSVSGPIKVSEINEDPKSSECDFGDLLEVTADATLVTLVVGETQLSIHRSLLVGRSPVFAAMLARDTGEASSSRIVISDVEWDVLQQLLLFMYKDSTPQLCSMAPQLLVAADKYCLPELKSQCELQLVQDLSVENAMARALLALQHSFPRLKEAAVCLLLANLTKVMYTEGWAEAVRNNPEEFVELCHIIAGTPAKVRSNSEKIVDQNLLKEAKNGHYWNVRDLLSSGAYVRIQDISGRSALHFAAATGHSDATLNLLLEAGADVEARDANARTALHYAAASKQTHTTEGLLQAGACVDVRDRWLQTPLHTAIQCNNTGAVQLLVAAAADVNTGNVYGDTPLHMAARSGSRDVIKKLLDVGGDKGAENKLKETPLDVAKKCNKDHLLAMLR